MYERAARGDGSRAMLSHIEGLAGLIVRPGFDKEEGSDERRVLRQDIEGVLVRRHKAFCGGREISGDVRVM